MGNWNNIASAEECSVFPPLNTWVMAKYEDHVPSVASLKAPQDYGEMGGKWNDYHWCVKLPNSFQLAYAPIQTFTHWKQFDGQSNFT